MTCICTFEDGYWPSMEKDCPIHDRRKTLSEWWYTIWYKITGYTVK